MFRRALALCALPIVGCVADSDALDEGECRVVVWAQPERSSNEVFVRGSWDDWNHEVAMHRFEDGDWLLAEFGLEPGRHEYLIVEEGRARIDQLGGLSGFRASDGLEVSLLDVPDCLRPSLAVVGSRAIGNDSIVFEFDVTPAKDGAELAGGSILMDGPKALESTPTEGGFEWLAAGLEQGKHRLSLIIEDEEGRSSPRAEAVGWVGAQAPRPEDALIYQIMIDRYRGTDGAMLSAPPTPGSRAGGTLDGVTAELRRGTFAALGVSTLWLSPVYVNPEGTHEGTDGHEYEGYHGYWPLDSRGVDSRIGGESALRELVEAAHGDGIAVLLDLVPNHYYEANPRALENFADGWFHEHDPPCICGTPTCPWNGNIQHCWFTPYLPDVRFQHPDAMAAAVDDARWWLEEFDVDGFRIDAVPMMPRATTRQILHAVRETGGGRDATFNVAEVFTGPGPGGIDAIRFHFGPDGFDAGFDFPLMWALRDALGSESIGFDEVEDVLVGTDEAIEGSGSVMARMLGNHDTARFASSLAGDAGDDPWASDAAPQPSDEVIYARQQIAMGLVLTLPGVPVIYYGDEVGLAGATDPDCRRVMPDEATLSPAQAELRDATRRLGQLRRCLPALRSGVRAPILVSSDRYGFVRDAGDGAPAIILVSRSDASSEFPIVEQVDEVGVSAGDYVDVLTGETFSLGGDQAVSMPANSIRVLVAAGHACG